MGVKVLQILLAYLFLWKFMLVSSQGTSTGVSFGDNRMSGKQGWRRRFRKSYGDEERKM